MHERISLKALYGKNIHVGGQKQAWVRYPHIPYNSNQIYTLYSPIVPAKLCCIKDSFLQVFYIIHCFIIHLQRRPTRFNTEVQGRSLIANGGRVWEFSTSLPERTSSIVKFVYLHQMLSYYYKECGEVLINPNRTLHNSLVIYCLFTNITMIQ